MEETAEDHLRNMPLRSEDIAFAAAELTACPKCSRQNAPNRSNCLYCGADLPLAAEKLHTAKIDARRPESWENGFNIIYLPENSSVRTSDPAVVAKHLAADENFAANVLQHERPLPATRLGSRQDAEKIAARLSDIGIRTLIIADSDLRLNDPPTRLRRVDLDDGSMVFTTFNTSDIVTARAVDIRLIVTGIVQTSKKRNARKKEKKGNGSRRIGRNIL